jgi:ATP-binding cassette subfamily D (ALD) long-chain fatty acid import protein
MSSSALLSPSNKALARARLKQALDIYLHHRPTVQRLLTAGFVLYCLGTTYGNLSGKGARGGAREKTSRRGRLNGKFGSVELTCFADAVDGKKKVSVSDPLFYVRLKRLIRIVIPSIRSREAGMLALHSAFLLLRTGISLYVADLDGR